MMGLALCATWLAVGCFSEKRSEQDSAGGTSADTASYRVAQFKDFSPYLSGTENGVDSTLFTARYPVFEADINELVKDAIFIDGENTVEQVAQSFLGGFNEYAEEQIEAGNEAFHPWFKHQDCSVVLNKPGFLTLRSAINDYTGGAHGMELELYFSYDPQQKKRLQLTDIVQDTTQLLAIAEDLFRKQENLSDTAAYGSSYFFDSFVLSHNFGLTPSGLLFHYNPYEIKAYAEGPTVLIIPYEELKDIMTDKGKALLSTI